MLKNFLQGRFMHHPLHPILVHFPVGLWFSSLILDIAYFISGSAYPAIASYYMVVVGLAAVVLAIPTGLAEYVSIPMHTRPRRIATAHMMLNAFISILYLINFFMRRGLENGVPGRVSVGQFILSLFSIVLLGVSGYLGGLLVYEFGVGHRESEEERGLDNRRAA